MEEKAGKKRRVMLVDDEEDFLLLEKMNLEQTGKFEVKALSDAKGILYYLHGFKPDIILLDMLMPDVDGIEVCQMLNNDSLGKTIPIIIVSALHTQADQLRAYKMGVVDYIDKPMQIDELVAKIEKALQYK